MPLFSMTGRERITQRPKDTEYFSAVKKRAFALQNNSNIYA